MMVVYGELQKLHRRNYVPGKGKPKNIDYCPWWLCTASYSKLHRRNCIWRNSETSNVDNPPWWPLSDLKDVYLEQPCLRQGRNCQKKRETEPHGSEKISLNVKIGLACDWPEYDPALITASAARTYFIDPFHAYLRLHSMFAVGCTTNCTSQWHNSDCLSCTTDVEDGMPTCAPGYEDKAYTMYGVCRTMAVLSKC